MPESNPGGTPPPPIAKQVPTSSTLFGDTRVDEYAWLRNREDPETIAYLTAENAYFEAMMQHTKPLQEKLYGEMLGRIEQTDRSAPTPRDGYRYYTRTEEGKQYAVYCRAKIGTADVDGPEEILLDGNVLGEGKPYFRVGNFAVSPDHRLLAYSVDFEGDETYTIHVKDLDTGSLLADEIPNTYYTLAWGNDNATFFYTVLDAAKRPYKVFRHVLGNAADDLVYHEEDERFTVDVEKTSSRAYILINIESSLTSEVRFVSADRPLEPFRIAVERVQEVEYSLTHHGTSFFIRTNDHAQTFRVVEAPVADASRPNWSEFLPARPDVTIEDVHAFRDYLIVEERDQGLIKFRVHRFATGDHHYVPFDEPVYTASLGPNAEYDTKILRYHYTSLVTPASAFDYDMVTRQSALIKQEPVRGGFDASQYETRRIYAPAEDGTQIPISLVHKRGLERNGEAPMLLFGYGSYGLSIDPTFRSDRLSLIDRGFVFAIAHIRGGGYLGKPWHESARMLTKKRTFTDFIACAEHLIAERYTSPRRLAIMGGSAGGLLMGAVVNLRPDLFGAVVALVPFVDVLNTILDPSLPLTVGEWEEWGNPAEEEYYGYMKSYSPYENLAKREYPSILATAGLNDPRVAYWEPAKWVARMRALGSGHQRLLLKTNMGSGHFGSSGRYEHLRETAFHYAFVMDALGVGDAS